MKEIKAVKKLVYTFKLQNLQPSNWFDKTLELYGLEDQPCLFTSTSHLTPDETAKVLNTHLLLTIKIELDIKLRSQCMLIHIPYL